MNPKRRSILQAPAARDGLSRAAAAIGLGVVTALACPAPAASASASREGCIAELSDGTIYYNSRAYFMDGKRRVAYSYDGGETFDDFRVDETLIEPMGGCSAGLVRYPFNCSEGRDVIIFSNPASAQREKFTVRLSYDGGKTWPVSKVIHDGPAAYSSMAVSEDGIVFVLYENGEKSPYEKISLARFSLHWLAER